MCDKIFWLENLKGKDHLEDQGIDGRIIFEQVLRETGWKSVDLMHLVQDRDWWQALVNTVMNLWVSQKVENFLTS
jgi:hypothetical protein